MDALLTPDSRLPGRFIWPARIGWLLLVAVLVAMFAANAPTNVIYAHFEYQVQLALPAVLSFTTLQTFAQVLVAARWLVVGIYCIVALFIAWRKWNDWFALYVSATLLSLAWGLVLRSDSTTWQYPPLLLELAPGIDLILEQLPILGLALLFFLFPTGRFVFGWHRWLALLVVLVSFLFFLGDHYPRLWRDYSPFLEQWGWLIWATLLFTSLLVALAGQVYRYRRLATATQQQQMKWVLVGLGGILSVPLVTWPLEATGGAWGALVTIGWQLVAATLLPLTIGFSILRYRLWDVDLLINRTLVFGGLTLLVVAAYVLVVGLVGVLLQAGNNVLLSILATGLIAILFHPVRQRLQQAVNRLMYGERDDPVTVLSRLGEQLEHTAVPTATLPAIVETIAQTLKLPYAALVVDREQFGGLENEVLAEHGRPVEPLTAFPLVYQGQHTGRLLVAPRAAGETFTPAETRLLENIARQAGAAVYAYQLTHQLQRSRERLVTAREEERRRLRRDLHDGLGPQLATFALQVDAARNYLSRDPETAGQLLVELKGQLQGAIQDVRRLAYDLRPPALDQLGLVPALCEYATQNSTGGLSVSVTAPPALPPLSAAVEVAVYRIAVEAITNVARHAQATHCTVRLSVGEELCLQIEDDGRGLAAHAAQGVGLSSMRERAAELGGTLALQSQPGEGTQVSIRLPLTRIET